MVKKQKTLTLSVIIPVYNEENYIRACLESIAEQSVLPLEVIVVDNNSSDATPSIVREFPFVRVIREPRQHQSFAQHTGFAAAKGNVIGRIDADTILPRNWVEKYLAEFEKNDDIIAFSGSGSAYDTIFKKSGEYIFRAYMKIAAKMAGHRLMWGSNCAFKKSAWKDIKDDLLLRQDIWEDYDLSFCLAKYGRIENIDNEVSVSYRAVHRTPLQVAKYQLRSIRTFYLKKGWLRASLFALSWSSMAVMLPFALFDAYILQSIKNLPAIKLLGESLRG